MLAGVCDVQKRRERPLLFLYLLLFSPPTSLGAEEVVNVYSYREPELIKPMLDRFTKETGIKVNYLFAKDGLIERMQAEAVNSPADVLLTNEFGLLIAAKEAGVTAPLKSEGLGAKIPKSLQDPEGYLYPKSA